MGQFQDVAILGAGTMGHALALVHAIGGCRVRLTDNSPVQLERAGGLIASALDTLIKTGGVDASRREAILASITLHEALDETIRGADLIVEAVVEDVEVKRTLFAETDAIAREDAVIASNTSHLDVFPLIPDRRQQRAAIAHWYTPPYIIDLVDLAPGPSTSPEVMTTLEAFYRGMGKRPVRFAQMVPSYVANRLQAAIALEIADLLDRGLATPQMIDDSIKYGLSLRMVLFGHLMKTDFTGLDMARRAFANGTYTPPVPRGRCDTLDKLVAEGRMGVMSGAGFFDYGGRPPEQLFAERDRNLLRLKALQHAIEAEGSEAQ